MHTSPSATVELTLATSSAQLTQRIAAFKRQQGISTLIACCGGAAAAVGAAQEVVLAEVFAQLQLFAPRVAILTGGTLGGLPETATLLARKHGLPVLAVVPACAKPQHLLREVACRIRVETLVVNSTWGSEGAVLMNLADGLLLLGGGAGTLIELANAVKINEGRLRAQAGGVPARLPIVIAPVAGHGGVTDLLPSLREANVISRSVWEACFPAVSPRSGTEAAAHLLRGLALAAPPG